MLTTVTKAIRAIIGIIEIVVIVVMGILQGTMNETCCDVSMGFKVAWVTGRHWLNATVWRCRRRPELSLITARGFSIFWVLLHACNEACP